MEELTPVGITVSGGNITGIGGTLGTVDNAVPRADGTGGFTVQGSNIIIDDATTSTQNNVALRNDHTGQTNSALVLTPKGTGAFILGPKPDGTAVGGNARGARAIDIQLSRSSAAQVANGAGSVAIGQNNTASDPEFGSISIGYQNTTDNGGSVAIGSVNTATNTGGYGAVALGHTNSSTLGGITLGGSNSASASRAIAIGQTNTSNASYASAIGFNARGDRLGMHAHSVGQFAASGDAQRVRFVLRCKTTTNAAVEMALDGSTTYLTIPNNKAIFMNIKVVGVRDNGAEVATYERQYAVKNVSLTSSQIYAPVTVGTDNAAGTVLDITTQDVGDYVSIRVTGIAAQTWRWVASVDAVEVERGT
jgi:hypothetical protein